MTMMLNGTRPHPLAIQFMLDGTPVVPVRDDRDPAGRLLDELDSLISDLDTAIADADAARQVIADAESEMAIIEASVTLGIEGRNEALRKALIVLALRDDAGFQALAATAREARASLRAAERRLVIIKQRIGLVWAAVQVQLAGLEA